MKVILRRGGCLLPGIFLILLASAQAPKPTKAKTSSTKKANTTTKKATPMRNDKTLLWQITGNGLKKPSYIFGTMHLLCEDDARLSPNLKKAIAETGGRLRNFLFSAIDFLPTRRREGDVLFNSAGL